MLAARILLALALTTATLAFVPSAEAAPCVYGDRTCLVGVETYVCVTEPCEGIVVCVQYGAYCTDDL